MDNTKDKKLDYMRSFWDRSAQEDSHDAILSGLGGTSKATQLAFEALGERDGAYLSRFVHGGARALDLGCAIGRVARPMAPHCKELIGIDISREMLAEAKEYLAGVENVSLVLTEGSDFPGIADESVDFVYSLLCLIHVDKRSAYRYMAEIARVLVPRGKAMLQFENIMTPEGLSEFQRVATQELNFPLEFYSPREVRMLLASVGLEVYTEVPDANFLNVIVVKGNADKWSKELSQAISLESVERQGLFSDPSATPAGNDTLAMTIRNTSGRTEPMIAHVEIRQESDGGDAGFLVNGTCKVVLPPKGEVRFSAERSSTGELVLSMDGKAQPHLMDYGRTEAPPAPPRNPTRSELFFYLLPPGVLVSDDALKRFAGLVVRG